MSDRIEVQRTISAPAADIYAVLAQRSTDAVRYADEALKLNPSLVWIEINRAHALLVL